MPTTKRTPERRLRRSLILSDVVISVIALIGVAAIGVGMLMFIAELMEVL